MSSVASPVVSPSFMRRRFLRWALISPVAAAVVLAIANGAASPYLWAFVVGCSAVGFYAIHTISPDLARERYHPPTPGEDGAVLFWLRPLALTMLVFALLDSGRWHWSAPMPAAWRVAGVVASLFGVSLFVYAMSVNRFFSSVVRIQKDRGHHVVDWGPYARVRHPGYVGMLLFVTTVPLALGSWWAFVAAGPLAAFALARVRLEDGFLMANLPSYREYAGRVRYRLLPGVW